MGKPVVIDYGCGDFNVGKNFINEVKTYYAYDVVDNLIKYNKKKFKFKNLHFKKYLKLFIFICLILLLIFL